jgi:hypothetical protein
MEQKHMIAGAPEAKVRVRVRGLSHDQRYFDEQTSTSRLTQDFIVIRLRDKVDLDSELHVTNMRTQIGGTFRVTWMSPSQDQGVNAIGLELLDPEGEIWESESIPDGNGSGSAEPVVLLECQRCYLRVSTPVPEVETESLREGFSIARHCDTCKATTGWAYCVEKPQAEISAQEETASAGAASDASAKPSGRLMKELRDKGRAPIRMGIKIMRTKYGLPVHDICETINVSRTGVYFTTEQGYEPGEIVQVILPYHPESMDIPVRARVVRQDSRAGTYQKRVALRLNV